MPDSPGPGAGGQARPPAARLHPVRALPPPMLVGPAAIRVQPPQHVDYHRDDCCHRYITLTEPHVLTAGAGVASLETSGDPSL